MKILLSALVAGLSMAALPTLAAELAPIAPMVPTTSMVPTPPPTPPLAQLPAAAAPAQPKIARGLLLLHEGRVFMAPCRDRSYVNVEDVSEAGAVLAALRDFGLAPGNNLYVELMGVQEGGLLRVSGSAPALTSLAPSSEVDGLPDGTAIFVWAAAGTGGGLRGGRVTNVGDLPNAGPHQQLHYSLLGTPGSPVFDREGRVVGVHAGTPSQDAVPGYGVRIDVLHGLLAGL